MAGHQDRQLRHITNQATDSSRRESTRATTSRRWTLITNNDVPEDKIYLPLNQESAEQFDGVVTSFQQLASAVLRVLHVEMRAHVQFYVLSCLITDVCPRAAALRSGSGSADAQCQRRRRGRRFRRALATGAAAVRRERPGVLHRHPARAHGQQDSRHERQRLRQIAARHTRAAAESQKCRTRRCPGQERALLRPLHRRPGCHRQAGQGAGLWPMAPRNLPLRN